MLIFVSSSLAMAKGEFFDDQNLYASHVAICLHLVSHLAC